MIVSDEVGHNIVHPGKHSNEHGLSHDGAVFFGRDIRWAPIIK